MGGLKRGIGIMKKCSVCKKNIAMMRTAKIENGKTEYIDLCLECAEKMGYPVMDEIMNQINLSPDEMDNLSKQMNKLFDHMSEDEDNPLMNLMSYESDGYSEEVDEDEEYEDEEEDELYDDAFEDEEYDESPKRHSKKSKLKTLKKYGVDLIEKAKNNEIDRIIGRHREIDRVVQILNRR